MRIDSYTFGQIVIHGQKFTKDIIVFPDRVFSPWRRRDGHGLHPADLDEVIKVAPGRIIIGTGASGMMKVPSSTIIFLEEKGIDVWTGLTDAAVAAFNEETSGKSVIAALHLTC